MNIKKFESVFLINEITDADIWIMPDTEENRKTTLWGKATVSKAKKSEPCQASLCKAGDNGLYIIKMIDVNGFFYSCVGVELEAGCTLKIKEDSSGFTSLEVVDKNGVTVNIREVFSARL